MREWLDGHTARSPAALRTRVLEYAGAAGGDVSSVLASAAAAALETVVTQPPGRGAALDLLAADALVTLALLSKAESEPGTLAGFAASLVPGPFRPAA